MSNALVNAGLISFQKIEDTNPREIELVSLANLLSYRFCSLLLIMVNLFVDCKQAPTFWKSSS